MAMEYLIGHTVRLWRLTALGHSFRVKGVSSKAHSTVDVAGFERLLHRDQSYK